jgi:CheY-like chemotaxis protein
LITVKKYLLDIGYKMIKKLQNNICPPTVRELLKYALNKLNADCSSLIGRNFGIAKPDYEMTTIEEFFNKNEGNFFLIKSELEDSYEGHIYNIMQLKDAIKVSGALLGSEDNQIKEKLNKEDLDEEYLDGLNEFGNQFTGIVDTAFRHKLPKPVHTKLSACTPLNKVNAKDYFSNDPDHEFLYLSSLLLIKGFEPGTFGMLIPLELVVEFFGEDIHEKKTNVLVMDDSMPDIRAIKRLLVNTEFRVIPANNVAETFTLLHKEKIHLILLDVIMPEKTGLDICRKIKKTPYTKTIPLIMISAKPTETIVIESLEAGAKDFLVKPFTKEKLLSRINKFKFKEKPVSVF